MLQNQNNGHPSEFESNERPSSTKDEHKKSPSFFKQLKDDFIKGENAFRSNMENFMIKNGKWLVQIVAIMAFLVTLLYIALTYLDDIQYPTFISSWYLNIEKGVVISMLFMYLINWYINPDRMSYVYATSDSIIALICIVPILSFKDMTMNNNLFAIIGVSRYFRFYYFLKIILQHVDLGQNEVDQSIYKSILTIMTIIIISAGIFAEIENGANIDYYRPKDDGSGDWEMHFQDTDGYQFLNFHDSFYFVMVTLSTVGYGDINPTTEMGEVMSLIMLLITMIYVPTQTSELLRLVSIKSKYRTAVYPGSESDHVVVTGHVGINAIQNFCEELFHEEHNNSGQQKNAVLVQDHDPIPEIDIFVQKYEKLMYYLAGDPLEADSMMRANAHQAEACILLTDKNSQNSSEEDYRNILIALSIKKFVYDQMKDQCNVRLCMQLIKPESKHLYYKSVKLSPLRDQLIIVEEIKMNLLAKSCFAPGLIAMVSNLIASASEIDHDEGEEEVKEWFKEYTEGMGHEIYRVEIQKNIFPDRVTFKKIAEVGFSEFRSIVFALEIQSSDGEKSIIRLNPNCFEFTDWDHFKFYIYIICESDDDAKMLEQLSMNDDSFQRTFGVPRMTVKLSAPDSEKQNQTAAKKEENSQAPEEDETQKLMNPVESKSNPDVENFSAKEKKTSKDNHIGPIDSLKFLNEDEGNDESVFENKNKDEEFYKDYQRTSKKQTQMDVSEESQLLGLKDHIVVCGFHSSIQHFILPLRAKYLDKKMQQIVIITPIKTIPEEIWDTINRFPQIYLKNGSPLEIETLRAAQLHKADKAVILGHDPTTDNSNELNDEMLDAQSIFIYKALKKCNPYIKVFTEMSFSSNIDFLMDRNSNTDKELSFQHSTLYAAGEVYISTLIDTLTAQAIYNQNIVTILQQILVGRTTSFYPKFEDGVVKHFGAKLQQANLWQIHVPEEMNNKTFDKLYKFLLDKGMVTLGLYRLPGANENQYPYVFTNPNQKIPLTNRDRVFVVGCSNDIPQEMIIDASKERAEMANYDGAVINNDDQGDAKKNEKNSKSTKKTHKTGNMMPNNKDFYGMNLFDNQMDEMVEENDSYKSDQDADDFEDSQSNVRQTKGKTPGGKTNTGLSVVKKPTNQDKNPPAEPNSTLSIELIKQAVDNLKRRVDQIEMKINDVEYTLHNQNSNIRSVVLKEKNKFLSHLDP